MKKRFALVIDQERCIGCEACTVACWIENDATAHTIRVITQDVPNKDTPLGRFPDLTMHFMPQLCNHCDTPSCIDACPCRALFKRDDGPVILDRETCDGCQVCLDACPYGAIQLSPKTGRVEKCNFCIHRIDEGLEPFCVVCCEGQALHFGDANHPESRVAEILAAHNPFTLKPEAGTGPSVYYLPPKKPRGL